MISQLWIICLALCSITYVVKTNPVYIEYYDENEMDLTDEQLNALIGTSGQGDLDGELVWANMSYKWDNGIIPYEFKSPQEFDGTFVNRILNAINYVNQHLEGCILIR